MSELAQYVRQKRKELSGEGQHVSLQQFKELCRGIAAIEPDRELEDNVLDELYNIVKSKGSEGLVTFTDIEILLREFVMSERASVFKRLSLQRQQVAEQPTSAELPITLEQLHCIKQIFMACTAQNSAYAKLQDVLRECNLQVTTQNLFVFFERLKEYDDSLKAYVVQTKDFLLFVQELESQLYAHLYEGRQQNQQSESQATGAVAAAKTQVCTIDGEEEEDGDEHGEWEQRSQSDFGARSQQNSITQVFVEQALRSRESILDAIRVSVQRVEAALKDLKNKKLVGDVLKEVLQLIDSFQTQSNSQFESIALLNAQLESVQTKKIEADRKILLIESQNDQLREYREQLDGKYDTLQLQAQKMQQELTAKDEDIVGKETRISQLDKSLRESQQKVQKLQIQCARLEEQNHLFAEVIQQRERQDQVNGNVIQDNLLFPGASTQDGGVSAERVELRVQLQELREEKEKLAQALELHRNELERRDEQVQRQGLELAALRRAVESSDFYFATPTKEGQKRSNLPRGRLYCPYHNKKRAQESDNSDRLPSIGGGEQELGSSDDSIYKQFGNLRTPTTPPGACTCNNPLSSQEIDWDAVTKGWLEKFSVKNMYGGAANIQQQALPRNTLNASVFKFMHSEEESFSSRDFMNLRDDPRIVALLRKSKEPQEDLRTFSDKAYRLAHDGQRQLRIVFATTWNVYLLNPNRNLRLVRRIAVDKIHQITFSNKMANLLALHIEDEFDYLLEIFRRNEFNLFIMESCRKRALRPHKIVFSEEFDIRLRTQNANAKHVLVGKDAMASEYLQSYKDAQKSGLLKMFKSQVSRSFYLFSDPWDEVFVVLTQIGLLIFKEPGQPDGKHIPVAMANLFLNPIGVKKQHCIKIAYSNSNNNQEYFFAADSKIAQMEWYDAIHRIIKESLNSSVIQKEQQLYHKKLQSPNVK